MPASARWDFGSQAWVAASRDASGELDGALQVHAADGTLRLELEYRAGARHGACRRYHASGRLAQQSRYYREIRAVLLFYCDPKCRSPWQNDMGRRDEPARR